MGRYGKSPVRGISVVPTSDVKERDGRRRCTPLAKPTVAVLAAWIKEQGKDGSKILFPSARGGPLSSDSVQYLATKYAAVARKNCPRCRKSGSHHMCFDTQPQWNCCKPEWIVRSSHSGWVTNRSRPPRSTSNPGLCRMAPNSGTAYLLFRPACPELRKNQFGIVRNSA